MRSAASVNAHPRSVADLDRLSRAELMALFMSLEAPGVGELDGEYTATLLEQGSWLQNRISRVAVFNPLQGKWLTKSFQPTDDRYGHGYDSF